MTRHQNQRRSKKESKNGRYYIACFASYRHWHSSVMLFEHFNDIPLNGWPYTYFKPNEVACRGTGKILINETALAALDILRSRLGHSINLSSAYRSPYHNSKIGGAPRSSHLKGHAFDVQLQGRDKETIRKVAQDVGFKGFGMRYQTFIHIDMGRRRQW